MNGAHDDFYLVNGSHSLPIAKSIFRIGRAEFCDVCPSDPGVSRNHVELVYSRGVLKALDLDSTNGTYVNGKRVTECQLLVGDVLEIASTSYIVESRPRGLWERLTLAAKELVRRERNEPSAAPATYAPINAAPKITGAF